MPISVTCPNGHTLKVKDEYAGQTGLCPKCQARVLVPALNEDWIVDLIGPPPAPEEDDTLPVHQDPKHRSPAVSPGMSGSSVRGSSTVASKTKMCPKCHQHVNARFDFCPHCGLYFTNWDEIGRRLLPHCEACGAELVGTHVKCPECGAAVQPAK